MRLRVGVVQPNVDAAGFGGRADGRVDRSRDLVGADAAPRRRRTGRTSSSGRRARLRSRWSWDAGYRRGASSALCRRARTSILLNTIWSDAPWRPRSAPYYNAALLVTKDGPVLPPYLKQRLVPFGEYVPLGSLLRFIGPISRAVPGAFTPADAERRSSGSGASASAGPSATRSSTRGSRREHVRAGADVLFTLTNDAWYGTMGAQRQHWQAAVLRAVETGRPLVRAAITGISGAVDPAGTVLVTLGPDRKGAFAVPLPAPLSGAARGRPRRRASSGFAPQASPPLSSAPGFSRPGSPRGAGARRARRRRRDAHERRESRAARSSSRPPCAPSGAIFDVARAEKEKAELEEKTGDPEFWNDNVSAQETLRKLKQRRDGPGRRPASGRSRRSWRFSSSSCRSGEPVEKDVDEALAAIGAFAREKELTFKLTDVEDTMPAILEIHAGQGGTEAQDWAEMLLRMYERYGERKGYKTSILEVSNADDAGIKTATLRFEGEYAYGHLKSEHGVHRLVRISPFDAAARRHTSFASVYVSPEIDDSIEVEINEKDLKIDTFRAGGKGGQHVNKTESAIRITHLPTGIVVSCQNERSQHKNRDFAMKVLRSRLYQKAVEERRAKDDARAGVKMEIGFGSQIRSYVLAPYRLVKDHRTGFEMGDVDRVLDGDLDGYVEAYLQSFAKHGEKVRTRQSAATLPDEADA